MRNVHAALGGLPVFLLLLATVSGRAHEEDRTPTVSLLALIANPDAYSGKNVRVVGFCSLEFEGTAVYLHEEDYRRLLAPNSVWLDVDPTAARRGETVHERYCLVEGTFDSGPARNGRQGRLESVTRLEALPSRAEMGARLRR